MKIRIEGRLRASTDALSLPPDVRFPQVSLDLDSIKAMLVNEIVPENPADDFYGDNRPPAYLTTTLPLFAKAGFSAATIDEITAAGIYITNAVKQPKSETTIPREVIERYSPLLEAELELFANLRVVMLMGDVAIKSFNRIAKRKTGKNVIPSGATYKLRVQEFYYGAIRVFPSYIMTGGNILIEKSKVEMASEDIRKMLALIA